MTESDLTLILKSSLDGSGSKGTRRYLLVSPNECRDYAAILMSKQL